MDSNGAKELARLIEERRGIQPRAPIPVLEAIDAAPIFHWIGVEPPAPEPSADEE